MAFSTLDSLAEVTKAMLRSTHVIFGGLLLTLGLVGTAASAPLDPPEKADPHQGFPRRLLAISIHNYPYANPVSYGSDTRTVDRLVKDLADLLCVPVSQAYFVSDRAPTPLPPTKAIVEQTIGKFLDTSRAQDRVIVLFVGHVAEIDGTPYLMPLLGESDQKETLIPLDWLYKGLAACKARQKVLILDVCRFDKTRGEERGAVEKMSAKLEALLRKPPQGVEVLTSCAAGQYSWEADQKTDPKNIVLGGVFLSAIGLARENDALKEIAQKKADSLPLAKLHKALAEHTTASAAAYVKEKQTPGLYGKETPSALKFDPEEAAPPRFKIELDKQFALGIADQALVQSILAVPLRLPPARLLDKEKLRLDALPPYAKDALAVYKDDGKDTDFRAEVKGAIDIIVKFNMPLQTTMPPLPENVQQKAVALAQLQNRQQDLATSILELEKCVDALKDRAKERDKETKLWQANHDYVAARLLARKAALLEYSAMIARVRKNDLPDLEKGNVGYKLAAKAALTDSGAKEALKEWKKILERIIEDHKGTPWEFLARAELRLSFGLEWQPY